MDKMRGMAWVAVAMLATGLAGCKTGQAGQAGQPAHCTGLSRPAAAHAIIVSPQAGRSAGLRRM